MEGQFFQVTIAGLGGQGALLFGRLLAEAALSDYEYVSFFPNYATIMRGGESECTVTLSNEEIDSPAVFEPLSAIVMSAAVFKQFEQRVRPGGMLFLDSSLVPDKVSREDVRAFYIPATKTAVDLGDSRVANLVFLGAYVRASEAVSLEMVERVLEKRLGGREALLSRNKEALRCGARLVESYDK